MGKQATPWWDRFWPKVDFDGPGGCWLWTGALTTAGYGQTRILGAGSKQALVHRLSYEIVHGVIPEGYQIDHLCRVRNCLNPEHLEVVTGRQNTLRGNTRPAANVAKTHCPAQHPYDETNTVIKPGRYGPRRVCRTCQNAQKRARYARSKEGIHV